MPELPEVETVKKGLEKLTKNFHITKIDVLKERSIASYGGPKSFINNIENSYIGNWERRGKYLIGSLNNNNNNNNNNGLPNYDLAANLFANPEEEEEEEEGSSDSDDDQ